jgi:hypothetical protein
VQFLNEDLKERQMLPRQCAAHGKHGVPAMNGPRSSPIPPFLAIAPG